MPLQKPYRAEMEEKPDASADWKGHYMGRFEKVEMRLPQSHWL